MSGLPRDIIKWIQSLDLTHSIRNTKRDLSNGYLIAEIFSWYYPQEVTMHSYTNGTSLDAKLGNWSQLTRFFQKQSFEIPNEFVDGVIHCKPGAAQLLIQIIYTLLTNRSLKVVNTEKEIDFTDAVYQSSLPLHARSTASQSIKNNISNTELSTEPDKITCTQKAELIISRHVERRRQERREDPERYSIKPSLGERSIRRTPMSNDFQENINTTSNVSDKSHFVYTNNFANSAESHEEINEIKVDQHKKHRTEFTANTTATDVYSY